jgi:hypothetical protein
VTSCGIGKDQNVNRSVLATVPLEAERGSRPHLSGDPSRRLIGGRRGWGK